MRQQLAGRRWPAEWEPHAATALTWPHNPNTWHQGLDAPRRALAEAIRALACDEHIHLHCRNDADARSAADLLGLNDDQLTLHVIESNDAWCRDHGALIIREADGGRVALDFEFNAWGGKYPPWDSDNAIAGRMAEYLGLHIERPGIVLEGGALDGNGHGTLLTTASCVLNANRNTGLDRAEFEALAHTWLGTDRVIWLKGRIPGDDTDAHVDNIARFVNPCCAVAMAPDAPRCNDEHALADNLTRLQECVEVRTLPMPRAFIEKTRLPASYANFYIGNGSVIVPVFHDPADDAALATLADCFRSRRIVPVDSRALVVGLGSLHCLTQQIPAP